MRYILLSEACNAFTNYIVKILHRRLLGFIYIAFKIIPCHKMKLEFNYKRKGITSKFSEYLQLFLFYSFDNLLLTLVFSLKSRILFLLDH